MKQRFLAMCVAAAAFSGCAQIDHVTSKMDYTTGTKVTPEMMNTFVDHKTTQNQVAAKLGYPPTRNMIRDNEIWTYPYTLVPAMPFKDNVSETTVFEFGKSGILVKHYKAGGVPGSSGNALLDAAGM